jgi:hypothetical protein
MLNPSSPRRLNFVKSIRLRGGDTAAEARALIGWLKGRKITWMTYDKHGASKSDRGGGSIIGQFMAHLEDESLWQTGKPILRKYKGEIDAGVRRVKAYLSPDPSEYFEPLISIDPPTEENGTANLINELANYRLKDSKYIGKPLKYNTIHEKKNEGPDNCRYLVMSRPEWHDHGPNVETGHVHRLAVVPPPQDKPKEVVTREEAERRAEMERSRAIAERAASRCKKQRPGWRRRIGDVFHP